MSSMNQFLLGNGLDVSSKAADLHAAVHPFLQRAWRSIPVRDIWDNRLMEAFVTYLRIQLVLGGLEAPESPFLDDVHELLMDTLGSIKDTPLQPLAAARCAATPHCTQPDIECLALNRLFLRTLSLTYRL